jgi:hypothetical protein
MPSGYPGSGPKKQGSKKDPKKDNEKAPGTMDRKPHHIGEALVSVAIKSQGATREGHQNNSSIPIGSSWKQPTAQLPQMPARVSASNLSHFARGAHVQPQQIPPQIPPAFNQGLGYNQGFNMISELPRDRVQPQQIPGPNPSNFARRTRIHIRDSCPHLFPPYPPRVSNLDELSFQGQGYDQWLASYQANIQANNAVIDGTQQGSNRPFSYPTPFPTNAHVAGPSHINSRAQSAAHGYNRQAMPYSAQHPGAIPYRNDYTHAYPSSVPPSPPPPSGSFTQPPGWYIMPNVQMPAAQQHPGPPPPQANQEYHFSNYTPIDQYQGVGNNATGKSGYNNPYIYEPAPLGPASYQAPNFLFADRAPETSVPVDARPRKRRRGTTGDGFVGGEVLDEEDAGTSRPRAQARYLARQAQRTAEDARAFVELAAITVEA